MEERKVFCARWLFCEALAQEAVAVVVVVVVCVELVVEVVLKSDFCAGCFPVCGMCRGGGEGGGMVSGRISGLLLKTFPRLSQPELASDQQKTGPQPPAALLQHA